MFFAVGIVVVAVALQATKHWAKAWSLVPLLALFGPVFTVRDGVSIVGLDLTVIPLLFLCARRGPLPPAIAFSGAAFVGVSLLAAMTSHAETTAVLTALKITLLSVLGGIGAFKSTQTDASSRMWFLAGLMGLMLFSVIGFVRIYSLAGIPPTEPTDLIKATLVLPFGASNYVASIAVLTLGAVVALTTQMGSARFYWLLSSMVLSSAAVFLSNSKWGAASLLVVVCLSIVCVSVGSTNRGRRPLLPALAALALTAALLPRLSGLGALAQVSETGLAVSNYQTGAQRVEIWGLYWRAFEENPLLGKGLGWSAEYWGSTILAHNSALELLGQGGLLLLISFVAFGWTLAARSFRAIRIQMLPLIAAVLLSGLLEVTLRTGWFDLIFFVAMGLSARTHSDHKGIIASVECGTKARGATTSVRPGK